MGIKQNHISLQNIINGWRMVNLCIDYVNLVCWYQQWIVLDRDNWVGERSRLLLRLCKSIILYSILLFNSAIQVYSTLLFFSYFILICCTLLYSPALVYSTHYIKTQLCQHVTYLYHITMYILYLYRTAIFYVPYSTYHIILHLILSKSNPISIFII